MSAAAACDKHAGKEICLVNSGVRPWGVCLSRHADRWWAGWTSMAVRDGPLQ